MVLSKIKNELELLERHVKILRLLSEQPLGIVKLSYLIGVPAHQVRYSLRVLQQSGFLEPTTKGALINARAKKFLANLDAEKRNLAKKIGSI